MKRWQKFAAIVGLAALATGCCWERRAPVGYAPGYAPQYGTTYAAPQACQPVQVHAAQPVCVPAAPACSCY